MDETKAIFELSKQYITQAGDKLKNTYQRRVLLIASLSYSSVGVVMTLLPYILINPVFLCKNEIGGTYQC